MHIPPWTIVSGLGSLKRRELCDLLAVFEDTSLLNIVCDRVRDLTQRRAVAEGVEDEAFRQRLKTTSDGTYKSHHPDAVLRLRLWQAMRAAFDIEPAIPLSTKTANLRAADIAQCAADALRDTIAAKSEDRSWRDLPDRLWSRVEGMFSRDRADFSTVVGAQASRMVAEAAEAGTLDDATKAELVEKIREQLDKLPPELRDQSVEQALKTGDVAALALLTAGGSLAGMDAALDAGAALDDLDVPVFAVAVSAAKNIHAWWKGSLPLEDLPFEVAVDGAVKGGLAAAGGFAGSTLGLLVFGPAGAVVFSGVGGAGALFGSGWARQQLDRALIGEWLAKVDATSERFRASLKTAMQKKIEILRQKAEHLDALDNEHVLWLKLRLFDNALAIAECMADLEDDAINRNQPGRATAYLRLMREASVHPWSVNSELTDLMADFARKPGLTEIGRDYLDDAVRKAEELAKRTRSRWFGSDSASD